MTVSLPRGLYLVTPDSAAPGELVARLKVALEGRPAVVQYRNKLAADDWRSEEAAAAAAVCRAAGVAFIINDDARLALEVGADGVHIGRDDGDIVATRAQVGPDMVIGVSCYDEWARAEHAVAAGADYIAFGAMYPSSVKPAAPRAALDLVQRAKREFDVGVATIGGITLDNAPPLVEAGADWVAVISDIFNAPDPAARAAAFRPLFAD